MDRLGDLPDQLLTRILSFLPTEEVVRTCTLSKRWRRVWAFVPVLACINLWALELSEEEFLEHDAKFLGFVQGVLDRREKLPLDVFELIWRGEFSVFHSHGYEILSRVMLFMPRVLLIDIYTDKFFNLPGSIFTCASLEKMMLVVHSDDYNHDSHDDPHDFIEAVAVNLPRLKKLALAKVTINGDFIRMLISGCPHLEDISFYNCYIDIDEISSTVLTNLAIWECYHFREIQISCPCVVSLNMCWFNVLGTALKNMPSLVTADLVFSGEIFIDSENHGLKLLAGLSNVAELKICSSSPYILDLLAADIPNCPTLNNLKSLHLALLDMNPAWKFVVCLLQHSPNLKTLKLVLLPPIEEATGEESMEEVSFQLEYLEAVKVKCVVNSAKLAEELAHKLGAVVKSIGEGSIS